MRRDDVLGSPNALVIDIHFVCGVQTEAVDPSGRALSPKTALLSMMGEFLGISPFYTP